MPLSNTGQKTKSARSPLRRCGRSRSLICATSLPTISSTSLTLLKRIPTPCAGVGSSTAMPAPLAPRLADRTGNCQDLHRLRGEPPVEVLEAARSVTDSALTPPRLTYWHLPKGHAAQVLQGSDQSRNLGIGR